MLKTPAFALAAILTTVTAGIAAPPAASAQPAPRAAKPVEIAAGRRALEAGRADEAIAQADAVLAKTPGQDDAAVLKVEALLSLNQREKAFDAYDAWFRVSQRENVPLAGRLARAELEALTKADLSAIRIDAVAALAASGQADARKVLESGAWASPATAASWSSIVALATLGDAKAQARVVQTARESSGSAKAGAIAAMAAARVRGGEAVLRDALATRDANLQAAAADAAAVLGLTALVPDLERVAKEGDQFGRFAAAVAAARLGGRGGDALVEAGLTSPALDARLLSASAFKARGRAEWVGVARPLLENPDGLIRFQAAELLLSADRTAALAVLIAGTGNPNIAIRAEVARILAADKELELAQLRRLLRDGAPRVRLEAARALLERTRATTRPVREQ